MTIMGSFDFVNRGNAEYIEQLYQQYKRNPDSVDEVWRAYFSGFETGAARTDLPTVFSTGKDGEVDPEFRAGIYDLVHTYRELGHYSAKLDPLGLTVRSEHPMLALENFNLQTTDLSRSVGRGGFEGATDGTLRDLIEKLRLTYCNTVGVEFTGIADKAQREWLQRRIEQSYNHPSLTREEKKNLLFQLIAAEEFEQYLGRAFIGAKRFSIEGGESLIPILNAIVEHGGQHAGSDAVVMAMAHRGRLNVLAHVLNKPYEIILSEFAGTAAKPAGVHGDGDVKYHLGYANTRPLPEQRQVKVSLLPNPSHLELINPIQQGIVRCKQEWLDDKNRTRTIPLCMHGDAAFCGQGIVAETLALSELPGYETGGTIHIIINNQIGFTTPPKQGRFTPYPTDMAKAIQAPIFHINGDDPEACQHVAKIAVEFRQTFKCDVLIDLWCYRRHGHNETDEPSFTQPLMYKKIAQHPTTRTIYQQKLIENGDLTPEEAEQMKQLVLSRLTSARELAREVRPRTKVPRFSGVWTGFGPAGSDWSANTPVKRSVLETVIRSYDKAPPGFTFHPKLEKGVIAARREMVKTGKNIDWGCAEMLAFGSILLDGYGIRFTGQDVERGTFSHRHAVLHDYNTGETFTPLCHVEGATGEFFISNSMLSEEAVLAYEWGYASADPRNLVIWEAQFGDFVNGAQAIIDQIIAAAESKWHYMCGLVMLLPHGYEGAGPEHSNAYVERFLSLCAEENLQVAMPSRPSSYFHMLRRQQLRKFRKPLILFMPKNLLRRPDASSSIEEFTDQQLQLVLDDPQVTDRDKVTRLLLCAGKVYYTLNKARIDHQINNVAIIRLEQFYPFPKPELTDVLNKYRRVSEVCWVQEEPQNRGAWSYMQPILRSMLPDLLISYHGRESSASPATGSTAMHEAEERELVASALELSQSQPTPANPQGVPSKA
ncbi:MAG: 2-oxoglutarate dehydrogenase subunit E1 [Phycisphaerae bacterium]|jgi:2-oxoglutarate dehydrogenase E1 component|nr:MAG: 2-oxoglutarate dehydrogenase subunit E1 [Phycisphaerae bacterium]